MGLLDSIESGSVDVRRAIGDNGKVVIDLDMFSSELYKRSGYRMVWLSYAIYRTMFNSDDCGCLDVLKDLYDFLDYHPDVTEHTPVYVVRYFPTSFVHPNPAYRDVMFRVMAGVVLDVRSRYYALRALYGIYGFIKRKYCGRLGKPDEKTVYWKIRKDEHHYEDYEYNYDITKGLFKQFKVYMDGNKVNRTAFDLAGFIFDGTKARMREKWDYGLAVKCNKRYLRDFYSSIVKDI